MIFTIIFLIFVLIMLFWQLSLVISVTKGAPTVYAKNEVINNAFRAVQLKKGQSIIDLGCGNARSLIIASRDFGARGIGVEISPFYFLLAKINVAISGQNHNIKIYFGDVRKFAHLIAKADIVYLFLMSPFIKKIEHSIMKSKKDDAKVISISFPLKSFKPSSTSQAPKFYIYD